MHLFQLYGLSMEYTNTCGVYQCFQGTDDMVAPDCRDLFFSIDPNGKFFNVFFLLKT